MYISLWIIVPVILIIIFLYLGNYFKTKKHIENLRNKDYLNNYLQKLISDRYFTVNSSFIDLAKKSNAKDFWKPYIDAAKEDYDHLTKHPEDCLKDEDGDKIDITNEDEITKRIAELI